MNIGAINSIQNFGGSTFKVGDTFYNTDQIESFKKSGYRLKDGNKNDKEQSTEVTLASGRKFTVEVVPHDFNKIVNKLQEKSGQFEFVA